MRKIGNMYLLIYKFMKNICLLYQSYIFCNCGINSTSGISLFFKGTIPVESYIQLKSYDESECTTVYLNYIYFMCQSY